MQLGSIIRGSLAMDFWVVALGQTEGGVRNLKSFFKKNEALQLKRRMKHSMYFFFFLFFFFIACLALTGKDLTEEKVQDTNIQQRHKRTEI